MALATSRSLGIPAFDEWFAARLRSLEAPPAWRSYFWRAIVRNGERADDAYGEREAVA
jgi:hypothetical protein